MSAGIFGYGANAATAVEAPKSELKQLKHKFAAFKLLMARNVVATANQNRVDLLDPWNQYQ